MKSYSPKMAKLLAIGLMGFGLINLGACGSLKRIAGAEKVTPDEFRVVTKAPLVVPPEFNLRPPKPGEARPLELRPDLQAKTAVFGVQAGLDASEGEKALISKLGATNADMRIREVIDEENGAITHKPASFADKIFKFAKKDKPLPSNPIDAEAEAETLRSETKSINNATGGQPVSIQQNKPRGFKLPGL